ncbi:hypothetical protein [Aquimarina algiphila]|uniref:hypothetical protein n=1 Tax=Aquimarina algiphila TaxID=2047982 RepID=UPI00232C9D2D|nr:hypothetical protein [Aquimarina algiphila]
MVLPQDIYICGFFSRPQNRRRTKPSLLKMTEQPTFLAGIAMIWALSSFKTINFFTSYHQYYSENIKT